MESSEHTFDMDSMIVGVGIYESIVSASIATDNRQSINIEESGTYSGSFMTLSIREIEKMIKNKKIYDNKIESIRDIKYEYKEDGMSSIDDFIQKYGFRGFNIDFNPRLIYSAGKATDMMVEAQIDNYVSFRNIKGLYYIDDIHKGSMEIVPTDKGAIFKNKQFSLQEKKELFNFLNVSMRYYRREYKIDEDNNSINDFKKNVYNEINIDMIDNSMMDKHFIEYMNKCGVSSKKMVRLISSCMCNYRVDPFKYHTNTFEDQSTKNMLGRLSQFIDSMNIHGELPYVYPIYGTGDVTQICSRISAVYGSTFLLDTHSTIDRYEYIEDHHTMYIDDKRIKCKNIYVGSEYSSVLKFLGVPLDESIRYRVRYYTAICKIDVEYDAESIIYPMICVIDTGEHPIHMLSLDHTCGNCIEGCIVIHMIYYIDDVSDIRDECDIMSKYIEMMKARYDNISDIYMIMSIDYTHTYRYNDIRSYSNNIHLLPDVDFDISMDNMFKKMKDFIRSDDVNKKLFNRSDDNNNDIDIHSENDNQLLSDIESFNI